MTEEKFIFAEQEFIYEKNDKNWSLTLKRSDVATQDLRELLLLDLHHPLFLEQETKADHDSVYFTYQIEPLGLSKEDIENLINLPNEATDLNPLRNANIHILIPQTEGDIDMSFHFIFLPY